MRPNTPRFTPFVLGLLLALSFVQAFQLTAADQPSAVSRATPVAVIEVVSSLTTIQERSIVDFSAAASTGDGTLLYSWDFGSGDGGSTPASPLLVQIQRVFPFAGVFTVTLKVEDLNGGSGTDQIQITVLSNNPPVEPEVLAATFTVNFRSSKSKLSTTIENPAITPGMKAIQVSLAGSPLPTFKVRAGKGKASVKTSDPALFSALTQNGASNSTVETDLAPIPLQVDFPTVTLTGRVGFHYKAVKDRSGKGKKL